MQPKEFSVVLSLTYFTLTGTSESLQVVKWRELVALPMDQGKIAIDTWGLKKLFSQSFRRWMSGSNRPRDTRLISTPTKTPKLKGA